MIDWTEAGGVVFTGLVVVFIALIILIFFVWLFGKIIASIESGITGGKPPQESQAVRTPSAPVAPAAPKLVVEDGIGDEVVAVISAAVASVLDGDAPSGGYAVTSITRSLSARPVWGFAGMQQNTRPF